ncbi:MAG: hypothetical protein JNK72_08650 [Myxococcales bacterium]|nr:hypothetical protein [Myxococcales bacterium]
MKLRVWLGFVVSSLCASTVSADPPEPPTSHMPGVGNERPRAPEFNLEGTSGAHRRLRDYAGRVVILIYEDRDSNTQNEPLKQELGEHARATDMTRDVAVVPVANLSGYNFWPARGFARDAVVDIARQQNLEILIDWSNSMAESYRFRPHVSYVMLLDRAGHVLFRHAGPLGAPVRQHFFSLVSRSIAAPRAQETAQRTP